MQVGFGVAVEYALDVGLEWIWARNQRLATLLRDGLRSIPGVRVHDHGRQLCSIVSFSKVCGKKVLLSCHALEVSWDVAHSCGPLREQYVVC